MSQSRKNKDLRIDVEVQPPKLSLKEMSEDIGAFLHFLKNHSVLADQYSKGSEYKSDICSAWMLIPLQLDVEFRKGIDDCLLEKEVYSRKILIISEPVNEDQKPQRRRELLRYFSRVLDGDQADQIINLLQKLDEKSRLQINEDFHDYRESLKKNNNKNKKPEGSNTKKV